MEKLKIENYICFPGKILKFEELTEEEREEFRKQMIRILQEQTNLQCMEKGTQKTNKILEDGENIPK
jgi:hypothetical protein